MFPKRFSNILFSLILSIFMTFMVSGVSSYTAIGINERFFEFWMTSWFRGWIIAFPAIIFIAPLTKKIVNLLTRD